jgi:peptidoglycan/LPS O-acetylase OafA/YrhL
MTQKRTRLFFIDNLRTLLIILVLLWHMAITYGAPGEWPYHEVRPDDLTALVFTLLGALTGPFVIGFWFMIAGYFTPGGYERRGPWRFIRDRLIRLGVPLSIYVFLIDPLIHYAINVNRWGLDKSFWSIWGVKGTFWRFLVEHVEGYSAYGIGVGPLWFIEVLLLFTLGYWLVRLVGGLAKRSSGRSQQEGKAPSDIVIAVFTLVLGLITFLVRLRPVPWDIQLLFVPFPYLTQYIGLFVVGIIAYRRNWLLEIPDRTSKLWFRIALIFVVVLLPVVLVLGGALEGDTSRYEGGLYWQSFAFSVWEQFVGVGMILGLLAWFRKRFDRQGRVAQAMSAASFAVYLIHAPVLVFLALALRNVNLHPLIKWACVTPVGVSLCFVLAHFFRRLPLVRRIL